MSRLPVALRRPMVVDIVISGVTLAVALVDDRFGDPASVSVQTWLFDVALCLPLLARRRQPLGCFAVVAAVALGQWLADAPSAGSVAVLVALFAVGAYESRRWAIVVATAVSLLGVVMAAFRWAPVDHRPTVVVLLTGTVTAAWMSGVYARTRRAYLASLLDRAANAERDRDQQALLATAAERARISREMHDIVAHTLSVMVALSDGAALTVDRDAAAARNAMEESSTLGRQALTDLRRLLDGLQEPEGPTRSPTPGLKDLDALVGAVRSAGLAVELSLTGQPAALPPGLQLAAYRLVQESLTNVLKHAPEATRATVTLAFCPSTIDIEIVNDGVATTATGLVGAHTGKGVAGMRERAAVFGGTVDAEPRPHGGWRVTARLRLAPHEELA